MKFSIVNGTDTCAIGLGNVGSYIKFNYPLTVVWRDNRDSLGRYFCVLPYNEDYRTIVEKKIAHSLNEDFSENIEGLYEILEPLLPIFKNGIYNLDFYSNKKREFFQYKTSFDNFSKTHFNNLEVVFAENTTNLEQSETVKNEHRILLKENELLKKHYSSDILEYATDWLYDGRQSFFATQPKDNIDQSRVKYFEDKLKNGERPFAILFSAYLAVEDFESSYFILDGHHKLVAYQNLGLYPPIALLTYLPNAIGEVEFDVENLAAHLYPWQMRHILAHWEQRNNQSDD